MKNEILNDGIKLYRPIYAVVDWVNDALVNGEHERTCGEHVIKVVKVLGDDRMPFYKVVDFGNTYFQSKYDERATMECISDGCFEVRKKRWSWRDGKTQKQINDRNVDSQRFKHISIYNQSCWNIDANDLSSIFDSPVPF